MQIIEWPQFLEKATPLGGIQSAITVGVFDGVHLGHKVLIEKIVAHNDNTLPVVVTFKHSRYKKNLRRENPGDIQSFRQRIELLESLGAAAAIVIEFSESFRRMTGTEFLRILREQGSMRFMAIGSDFRCGYQLDTDAPAIQKINARHGILTDIAQPLKKDSIPVSSSQIRAAIIRGELRDAEAMLGHPFIVDLSGAPAISADGGTIYDISGEGRILPPPGRYPVFLLERGKSRNSRTPAEILVEGGSIRIGDRLAGGGTSPEYVEFAPYDKARK